MKTRIILFLLCFLSLHAAGQGTVSRQKCKTCGKVISQCQYKGKHPYCKACGKLKERCEYRGEHPVCQTCGKLKERCEYRGEHPVCQTCGKFKEQCEYKGNHPICLTCGKLKEQCEYKGEHPSEMTFTIGGVSFSMMPVEGGTFTMGATSEQQNPDDDEKPTHRVTLSSFYIGKYEVTQALWKAVMGSNPSYFKGDNLPVEKVGWEDCQNFLRKLNAMTGKNFRLPTEAEWEYAARGGNRSRGCQYSGSNDWSDVAWYTSFTTDVGKQLPNELGIYDMSGNVYEWCQDWYGDYNESSQTNPTGPSSGSRRVIRGGGWCDKDARSFRVADRQITPFYSHYGIGFRLALSE